MHEAFTSRLTQADCACAETNAYSMTGCLLTLEDKYAMNYQTG